MEVASTLAYYDTAKITGLKSFLVQVPVPCILHNRTKSLMVSLTPFDLLTWTCSTFFFDQNFALQTFLGKLTSVKEGRKNGAAIRQTS